MSEPLTSHEIEDVLSSIRRLVSSELRPSLKPPVNGAAVDKLLLTPSLRIVGDPPVVKPAPVAPAPVAETAPEAAPAGGGDEAPMAVLGDDEIQVFFGEAAPLGRSYRGEVYDDAGLSEGGPGLRVVLDSRPTIAEPLTEADAGETADKPMLLRAAVPVVDWNQGGEDWAEDMEAGALAPPPRQDRSQEPLARAWADRAEAQIKEELTRPEMPRPAPVRVIPMVESPVGGAAQDRMGERIPPQAMPVGAEAAEAESDDSWIDEELLRDLVTGIIREELAGTLGERITRNVRKLVRLEVNRALTARDFE
ncbi:hypothetical protein [Pseudogemmobacter bohemicus]|uniref:hypothetical protein n=1 Tax=Pseudogemmobacter bohemicus TaxID=2250708 RepID=UPI000DD2C3AC|nr:hypothetical protein [Pseudogemmobacter bohemicus]